MFVEEKFKL